MTAGSQESGRQEELQRFREREREKGENIFMSGSSPRKSPRNVYHEILEYILYK